MRKDKGWVGHGIVQGLLHLTVELKNVNGRVQQHPWFFISENGPVELPITSHQIGGNMV